MLDNTASALKTAWEIPSKMPQVSSECKIAVTDTWHGHSQESWVLEDWSNSDEEPVALGRSCSSDGRRAAAEAVFYGELKTGKRPQHDPKRGFKDCIKDYLKAFKIPVQNWETLAKCRPEWSRIVRGRSEIFWKGKNRPFWVLWEPYPFYHNGLFSPL